MIRVKELILVEGKYDKNTLSQIVDATIIETSGFGIFHDDKKRKMIRDIADRNGVIIFTDSDSAGFLIRNHLKGIIPSDKIKNAYTPDVFGKEKRKNAPSKEGKLGVEGMDPDTILQCLKRAGATMEEYSPDTHSDAIVKADLFTLGLSGKPYSKDLRTRLKERLNLPERLSSTSLLEVLNSLMSKEELENIMSELLRENCD